MIVIEVITIFTTRGGVTVEVNSQTTIGEIKKAYSKKTNLQLERIALRTEIKGKNLKDDVQISALSKNQLYFHDLGSQISWKTVFLFEYVGPLLIYPIFYLRPPFIYGGSKSNLPIQWAVKLALFCSTFHYGKRLLETEYIHRFSNGTMPQFNLIKNCAYYWGFSAFMSYFINHPLHQSPSLGSFQVYLGLSMFILSEIGNLSIHLLFRNLRPLGSRIRKIPKPNGNPFSLLFNYVSCPNYTYEVCTWIGFTIMTQSLPSALFAVAGFIQMAIWAKKKHYNYLKEFPNYPKNRKAIIPFIL